MNNLVWIASYPRSGNTWTRALLTSALSHQPLDFSRLCAPLVSSRAFLDPLFPVNLSELSPLELLEARIACHRVYSENCKTEIESFLKIHDCLQRGPSSTLLTPPDASKAILYIVRNPLDVCVSFARYSGSSVKTAAEYITNSNAGQCLNLQKGSCQVPQLLRSWSLHVKSWLEQSEIPTILVRYEDLLTDTPRELARVLTELKVTFTPESIQATADECRFSALFRKENKTRPDEIGQLIRRGKKDQWLTELKQEEIELILSSASETMERLGYELP